MKVFILLTLFASIDGRIYHGSKAYKKFYNPDEDYVDSFNNYDETTENYYGTTGDYYATTEDYYTPDNHYSSTEDYYTPDNHRSSTKDYYTPDNYYSTTENYLNPFETYSVSLHKNNHIGTTEDSNISIRDSSSYNEVLSLPYGDCDEMENLISLNLSYAGINKINNEFLKNARVNCLNFSKNSIDFIAPSFLKNHPNLTYLNLGHNRIDLLKLNLNPHSTKLQLKTLVLDNNIIQTNTPLIIVDDLSNLENLYVRQLNINGITTTNDLKNLRSLFLSNNNIRSEEAVFTGENYFNLSELFLDSNKIRTFNGSRFSELEVLQLDNNDIDTLCNNYCYNLNSYLSLGRMYKLKGLFLSKNGITNIHLDAFFNTHELIILDLSKNKIQTLIEETFEKFVFLEVLLLNDNQLTTLPNFHLLFNIKILNLSYNNLTSIPTGQFTYLDYLENLTLSNNQIINIEQLSFKNLTSLLELDLSNNKLQNLPEYWMVPQNSLRILKVNDNYFTSFNQLSIYNAPFLEEIFLSNNALSNIELKPLLDIPLKAIIYIQNQSTSRLSEIDNVKLNR